MKVDMGVPPQSQENSKEEDVNLLHPSFNKIPKQTRYLLQGVVANVLFLSGLQVCNSTLVDKLEPGTIYAGWSFFFLPLSHLLQALLVFGWPDQYFKSLFQVIPIGLSGIVVGSFATEKLDQLEVPYASVIVLLITGAWNYLLTDWVMGKSTTGGSVKKEL